MLRHEADRALGRHLPIVRWIGRYRWGRWLPLDVVAGLSVAALLIPESLGYADVAGLPPEVGLYAAPLALLALLAYAVLGRSTILVVAASSSTPRSRRASSPASATTGELPEDHRAGP